MGVMKTLDPHPGTSIAEFTTEHPEFITPTLARKTLNPRTGTVLLTMQVRSRHLQAATDRLEAEMRLPTAKLRRCAWNGTGSERIGNTIKRVNDFHLGP